MKSTKEQLEKRGFISKDQLVNQIFSTAELIQILKSTIAQERTIAIKIIRITHKTSLIHELFEILKTEKALYTKIELQKTIAAFGKESIPYLIDLLGCIGNNQHKKINNADLKKTSFPLARDIAARILCQIGPTALIPLKEILKQGSCKQKLEAIDAIGHISYNYLNNECETDIVQLYESENCDELLRWKIIKTMRSFKSEQIQKILERIIRNEKNEILLNEAKRSLFIHAKRHCKINSSDHER